MSKLFLNNIIQNSFLTGNSSIKVMNFRLQKQIMQSFLALAWLLFYFLQKNDY
jgi:hypothetical protein